MKAMTSSLSSFTRPRLVLCVPLVVPALEPRLQLVHTACGERRSEAEADHEEDGHGLLLFPSGVYLLDVVSVGIVHSDTHE
jgi:hypothetical protein